MSEAEEWRDVVGYGGQYQVSSAGRVRSLKLSGWRILKPQLGGQSPYLYPSVSLVSNGRKATKKVHALVLEAFVGPRPVGFHACHNDGDRSNNSLSNLRWDTPAANSADRKLHGTEYRPVGSLSPHAKLSDAAVQDIRNRLSLSESQRSIAARHGVSQRAISFVKNRTTWSHV